MVPAFRLTNAGQPMRHNNYTILVVEDVPLIRMGAVDLLVGAGFQAPEADTAEEAIRILEARPDIQLVFTDVGMPGAMDGVKLSHYIRVRWPPMKLIVVSGQAAIHESRLPVGARFFAKPYDVDTIIQAMTGMLAPANDEHAPLVSTKLASRPHERAD
jgi:CheY-like chemotaxis protein